MAGNRTRLDSLRKGVFPLHDHPAKIFASSNVAFNYFPIRRERRAISSSAKPGARASAIKANRIDAEEPRPQRDVFSDVAHVLAGRISHVAAGAAAGPR
jgi:hypothetical protein